MSPTDSNTDGTSVLRPVHVFGIAAGLALIVGLVDSGCFFIRKHLLGIRIFHGENYLWVSPATRLLLFLSAALLLYPLIRLGPRQVIARFGVFLLTLMAVLDLLLFLPFVSRFYLVAQLVLATGVSFQATGFIYRGCVRFSGVFRIGLVSLALVTLGIAGITEGYPRLRERRLVASVPTGSANTPNILLIVLDTIGADALDLYGYTASTSPRLDTLADIGVIFEQAYSTAPWTLPSHASMFTGRLPNQLSVSWSTPLDSSCKTLAEHLRAHGYLTAGFAANTLYCARDMGLDRGFVHYEDYAFSWGLFASCNGLMGRFMASRIPLQFGFYNRPARANAEDINTRFLQWVSGGHNRPFFAFLNYFDAHDPYVAPAPFRRDAHDFRERDLIRHWWNHDKKSLSPADVVMSRKAYDECVRYVDEQIGRLFDELEERGLLANTLVIITADHGEQFGEHRLFGHGNSLYQSLIHVPLFLVWPEHIPANTRVPSAVSLCDLPATITDLIGVGPANAFPGRALRTLWEGAENPSAATLPVFAEIDGPPPKMPNHGCSPIARGAMSSVIWENVKYIRNGGGVEELYDLAVDPLEESDLSKDGPSQKLLERCRKAIDESTHYVPRGGFSVAFE